MSIEELLNENLQDKDIVIIGRAAAGKTYLGNLIAKKFGHHLISTDAYISDDFQQSLYDLIDDLRPRNCPVIVEGVLAYRLLRKGLESPEIGFQPQVVIELEVSTKKQAEIYLTERDPAKLKYQQPFALSCTKVLNDYYKLLESAEHKPIFYTVENNW